MSHIQRVIDAAGGVSPLANRLGIKPPTVSQWRSGDRPVPPRLAIAIAAEWPELATVHDLRPDVFGADPTPKRQKARAA